MEKWDVYNKYREKTGQECIRGEAIPDALYHLTVHVWIRNSRGEYLISQRSATRPTYPLMWECVGGSVLKGESSIEGAVREVKEEVGLNLEPGAGELLFTRIRGGDVRYEGKVYNDIMDAWLFYYDGGTCLDSATTDEVADCRWMTVSEIRTLYEEKKLVQSLDYFFCVMGAEAPDYSAVIGTTVSGTVDRPLGSRHPEYPDMIYPVNYGYADQVFAGDGEQQDVYVLGADRPLERFEGRVAAVWHRFNDAEDKWIVSLDDRVLTEEQILGEISFQEQFFYGKLFR